MTAVAITDANVQQISSDEGTKVQYGETMTPGDVAYKSSADNKYYLAANNDSAKQNASVIVLTGGEADSYGYVIGTKGAEVDIGGTVTVGTAYYLGTGGAIVPVGDLSSTNYVTLIGFGKTSTNLLLSFHATGVQVP